MTTQHKGIEAPWSWISLMFSGFYFFSFFYTTLTLSFVLLSLLFYAFFVTLYQQLIHSRRPLPLIAAMVTCGICASFFNPSAGIFFGYANFFAGYYLPRKRALLVALSVITLLLLTAYSADLWVSYYIFPGLIPAVSLAILGAFIQQADHYRLQEQRHAEEHRQLAAVAERERIARDLHDTLGHTLSSIALKAQLARKLGDRGDVEAALREIAEVAALTRESLSDVRSAISGYRSKTLQSHLRVLHQRLQEAGFDVTLINPLKKPDPVHEAAMVLLLTEAVTNIIRHSNGNKVDITLQELHNTIKITVYDNGSKAASVPGNGLQGMQERLRELGGTLHIDTESGFRLNLHIPV